MRLRFLFLLMFFSFCANLTAQDADYSENTEALDSLEIDTVATYQSELDTIVYNKTLETAKDRNFTEDLSSKYNDDDFVYTEEVEKEPEVQQQRSSPIFAAIIQFFAFFLQSIFPFLLGGFLVYLILKFVVGFDFKGFKKTSKKITITEKLQQEDEDLEDLDLESLLKKALQENNFRLAIRFYYLLILKELTNKQVINYHKDKTNSEYASEIKDSDLQQKFSYLSYIYAYVWYGEFTLSQEDFKAVEHKYQSFLNTL